MSPAPPPTRPPGAHASRLARRRLDPPASRPYPACPAPPPPEVASPPQERPARRRAPWAVTVGTHELRRGRLPGPGPRRHQPTTVLAPLCESRLIDHPVLQTGQDRSPGWCSRFHGEGYQEGYEEGNSLGIIEGRQYGTLHGAKIGSEIGCYQGFAFAWRCLLHTCTTEKDSKKTKALESLIEMIQKFPYDDPTYDKLHEDLDKIRGKFKQLCSLLNVQPDFKISAEGSGLSF
nr:oral cancer-overexpressed protein 1 [Vulpes vulpes]